MLRLMRIRIGVQSPPIVIVALALLGVLPGPAEAQAPGALLKPPTFNSGFYSVEQAVRGRDSFVMSCEECHSSSEFRGDDFEWTWRRQTVWNFGSSGESVGDIVCSRGCLIAFGGEALR